MERRSLLLDACARARIRFRRKKKQNLIALPVYIVLLPVVLRYCTVDNELIDEGFATSQLRISKRVGRINPKILSALRKQIKWKATTVSDLPNWARWRNSTFKTQFLAILIKAVGWSVATRHNRIINEHKRTRLPVILLCHDCMMLESRSYLFTSSVVLITNVFYIYFNYN